jgi:hypothetical protein
LLSAYLLARLFDGCVAARLRGDRIEIFDLGGPDRGHEPRWYAVDIETFEDWLALHWLPESPPEPFAYPDAVSFLGNGPNMKGPRWYSADGTILGFVSQSPGAYCVPAASELPGFADRTGASSGVMSGFRS